MTADSSRPSLDDLARQLADAVPRNLKAIREDLERNFKSLLQTGLAKMDLVTREEYDLQVAVLQRTREKLEALEERIEALERADQG
jgi:BMFP domain-containing protein YqiC